MSARKSELSTAVLFPWTPFASDTRSDSSETEYVATVDPKMNSATPTQLLLGRFAPDPGGTLRPWDAADEYLLQRAVVGSSWALNPVEADGLTCDFGEILVLNDDFGAITSALLQRQNQFTPHATGNPPSGICVVNDSVIARTAIAKNIERLSHDIGAVTVGRSPPHFGHVDILALLENLPVERHFDTVFIKIPKSGQLLEQQLRLLKAHIDSNTRMLASAMSRHVHTTTLQSFEKTLGPVHTSLARKKARLIVPGVRTEKSATASVKPRAFKSGASNPRTFVSKPADEWASAKVTSNVTVAAPRSLFPDETPDIVLRSHPALFSAGKLDPGTRLLLDHLPALPEKQVLIDLGCGNGVLGIVWQLAHPDAVCHFVDESAAAVRMASENHRQICPASPALFHNIDCLSTFADRSCDRIVCNPPFHEKYHTGPALAHRMFSASRRVLRPGGELWIVANRHLPYPARLKQLFGHCRTIAGNNKFSIYRVCH